MMQCIACGEVVMTSEIIKVELIDAEGRA